MVDEQEGEKTIGNRRLSSERLTTETNLTRYKNWEDFRQGVDCKELYGFLRRHHEHVFKDQGKTEGYLKEVFEDRGTAVVDRESGTNKIVGFADGRPQDFPSGRMLVISEVTSERRSFQSIATLLAALIEQHSDCEAALFSLPLKTEGDQRRAKIYQRVGFQPDERFVSVANSERVCYSMPRGEFLEKIKIFTERR